VKNPQKEKRTLKNDNKTIKRMVAQKHRGEKGDKNLQTLMEGHLKITPRVGAGSKKSIPKRKSPKSQGI